MLRRLPLIVASVCLSAQLLAAPLYQITDAEGHVTYTDKPPASSHEGDSKTVEQKPLNVLESQPDKDYQKSFDHNRAKAKETSETAWKAYDKALAEAKQRLASAKAAQKEGEAVKNGDMISTHNPSGATLMRTSDEYVDRQEALRQAVEQAEADLNAVLKNKPALRRN